MSRILVMEDDAHLGVQICNSLTAAGHQTVLFFDASSAIDYLKYDDVDLIVTDLTVKKNGVPVPDGGIKLISHVKGGNWIGRIAPKIIAISGAYVRDHMGSILATASNIGADVTLKKPFHPDRLLELVEKLLAPPGPDASST